MKTLIIVSKCLRVTYFSSNESWFEFHFKGVYAGELLKKVVLKGSRASIVKDEEYLIYVRVLTIENNILKGEILKHKRLEDCWDKS